MCIIGTTRGVLSALDVGRLLAIYANQTVHPVQANAIMRSTRQALADADPDAVARYAPDLVLRTSGPALRRR
eukprot:1262775-Alexandrium_andersonii.AAC.1